MAISHITHIMPPQPYAERTFSDVQQEYAARLQPTALQSVASVVGNSAYWLVVLLAARGLLLFISAGHSNRLVSVTSYVTGPFVAPFKSLFPYEMSVFEIYTAIAMVFYALAGWGAVQLLKYIQASNSERYWERG